MADYEKLQGILKELFGEQDFSDASTPNEIKGWDSLTHLDLVSRMEEAYNLRFEVDEITEMTSIGAIKKILEKHSGGQ
ncbi:MAG: acyl carrier protein [Candidatus Micrarchaeia archaeon]